MSTQAATAAGPVARGDAPVKAGTGRIYPEGLIGKKVGMTHLFTSDGGVVPVTIIQIGPCYITDLRSKEAHGYTAVQLGFEPRKMQRVSKALNGHFGRAGKGAFTHVQEIRCDAQSLGWTTLGQELKVGDVFQTGQLVDVMGTSIGRGFTGVVRRYRIGGQPSTRGTHEYRRHVGAIGCRKFPGHVHKGKRMGGHMGAERVTVKNLEVVAVKADENLIMVRGGVPGFKGGVLTVYRSKKNHGKAQKAA